MPKAARARSSRAGRANPLARRAAAASAESSAAAQQRSAGRSAVASTDEPNYLVIVRMISSDDPTISRLLSIPPSLRFDQFHAVLQVAFGWTDSHMHVFLISTFDEGDEERVSFMGRGPNCLTLQAEALAFDDDGKFERDYTVGEIFESEDFRKGRCEVNYEYDMGDSWGHNVTLLGRADPNLSRTLGVPKELRFFCLGGEGHQCAEDCGGAPGWEDLKEAHKPGKKADKERKQWYKENCANGDREGLDPYMWSLLDVNNKLLELNTEMFGGNT